MAGCDMCGNAESVYAQPTRVGLYSRVYEKRHLCRACFLSFIEKKIHKTIQQHRLIEAGDFLLLGLSGGKDSQLITSVLSGYRQEVPFELAGITVDEGIAGYRPVSLQLASELAKRCSIRHFVVTFEDLFGLSLDEIVHKLEQGLIFKEDPQAAQKSCAFCAKLRLKAMIAAGEELGANKLGLAFNLNDHVANVLVTMGTDDMGVTLMQFSPLYRPFPGAMPQISPLIFLTDKEIALYNILKGIPYQLTPECPYRDNMIGDLMRDELFHIEETFPGYRFSVYRAAQMLRPWALEQQRKKTWVSCSSCTYQVPAGQTRPVCSSCRLIGVLESLQEKSPSNWKTRLGLTISAPE